MANENTNEIKFKKEGKKDTKIGAVIILIISALVFLPAGGAAVYQSLFSSNNKIVFGSYDGKEIVYEPGSELYTEVAKIAENYKRNKISLEDGRDYEIFQNAFSKIIYNKALTSEVEKSGYSVPEKAVDREVVNVLKDGNGKFVQSYYDRMTDAERSELRKDIKKQLVTNRYVTDLFGDGNGIYGLKASDKEKEFLLSLSKEKKSYAVATFEKSNYPDKEVEAYAKNNAEKFVKYDMSVITANEKSEAESILKQIKGNELTFEDAVAVKAQKIYCAPDGKLTTSYRYQLENILEDSSDFSKIAELKNGEITEIIKTKTGYSIFRKDNEPTKADFTKKEDLQVARNYIKTFEMSTIESYYLKLAEDLKAEAAVSSFDKACKKFGASKVEVPAFCVNYGNVALLNSSVTTTEIASLPYNEDAYTKIATLKMNETSAPIVLGANIVVFKCEGIQNDDVAQPENFDEKIANIDRESVSTSFFKNPKVKQNISAAYKQLKKGN